MQYGYNVIFLLGSANDSYINSKVKVEAQSYSDILQADYIDAYRNITIKVFYFT